MIHKSHSPIVGHTRVLFELPASLWAHQVSVVGDFNQWCPQQTPLTQERDGAWRTALDLPRGQHYHFHYVVDGEWRTERHADGFTTLRSGCPTSLLHLP